MTFKSCIFIYYLFPNKSFHLNLIYPFKYCKLTFNAFIEYFEIRQTITALINFIHQSKKAFQVEMYET